MNHLELLKKYMKVVMADEPCAYLSTADSDYANITWSEGEHEELVRIIREIHDE